ncbi:MAG: hypothetical protein L0H14_12175, partial [Yaniella sp.]|uniref:hypothetical protein n=1 Tax=Yaniella sp. TaxID=2773929 RepID=UPI002649A244
PCQQPSTTRTIRELTFMGSTVRGNANLTADHPQAPEVVELIHNAAVHLISKELRGRCLMHDNHAT